MKIMKKIIWIVIVIVLVAFLAWWWSSYDNKLTPNNNVMLEEKEMDMPLSELVEEDIFEGVESFEIKDVTGGDVTGKAWIVVRDGETFHKVEVSIKKDLPIPENGDFYEGWLVKKTPTLDFFSTGEMIKDSETGKWILNYETEGDKSDYSEVVITLESDDDNPAPAKHILEGEAK
jgi:hypothetical protein